jgi:hypothetical protein
LAANLWQNLSEAQDEIAEAVIRSVRRLKAPTRERSRNGGM